MLLLYTQLTDRSQPYNIYPFIPLALTCTSLTLLLTAKHLLTCTPLLSLYTDTAPTAIWLANFTSEYMRVPVMTLTTRMKT